MSWLPPATPEEMAQPGWHERRHAEWYRRRNRWHRKAMNAEGYHLGKLGRGEHAPPTLDAEPEDD